jgi:hypothetical protein
MSTNEQISSSALAYPRHRAECECGWNGPWRQSENDALNDAADHRSTNGNQLHIVEIVTDIGT